MPPGELARVNAAWNGIKKPLPRNTKVRFAPAAQAAQAAQAAPAAQAAEATEAPQASRVPLPAAAGIDAALRANEMQKAMYLWQLKSDEEKIARVRDRMNKLQDYTDKLRRNAGTEAAAGPPEFNLFAEKYLLEYLLEYLIKERDATKQELAKL